MIATNDKCDHENAGHFDLGTYQTLAGDDNPYAEELEWTMDYLNEMVEYDDTEEDK